MKAFFDSSAFAKRYIEEPGSAVADEICMTIDQLGLSVICLPEIISALNRRLREKTIAREQYGLTKQRL
ncbi:MAG: type II toxin-antitoxin system VapC family toxin, partial [Verrucomicrobia bacterium]|nr:type II toxin-antitoxin system VapC family toxin [Verrucomicrobiota bacterium]